MQGALDLDNWESVFEEPSGETDKQWLLHPDTQQKWLYKPNKPDRSPDEASSEYAASVIAQVLEVPAATVLVGQRFGGLGCVSLNVVSDPYSGLVDGATFLGALEDDFDPRDRRSRGHSQTNISRILVDLDPPVGTVQTTTAFEVFADYLMFDAFIGNTDRHSKNWAIETTLLGKERLSKTFDHATSLGVTTRGGMREQLLSDLTRIPGFAAGATAHRFEGGRKQSLVDFGVLFLSTYAPARTQIWVERMEGVNMDQIHTAIGSSQMSPGAASLAREITTVNRERILRCLQSP